MTICFPQQYCFTPANNVQLHIQICIYINHNAICSPCCPNINLDFHHTLHVLPIIEGGWRVWRWITLWVLCVVGCELVGCLWGVNMFICVWLDGWMDCCVGLWGCCSNIEVRREEEEEEGGVEFAYHLWNSNECFEVILECCGYNLYVVCMSIRQCLNVLNLWISVIILWDAKVSVQQYFHNCNFPIIWGFSYHCGEFFIFHFSFFNHLSLQQSYT